MVAAIVDVVVDVLGEDGGGGAGIELGGGADARRRARHQRHQRPRARGVVARLGGDERLPAPVVAREYARGDLATGVAIDAAVVDEEGSGGVLGNAIRWPRHG